jgi:hypothetical protein
VTGGLALHLGGRLPRSDDRFESIQARLGQRVVRDVDIVMAQKSELTHFRFARIDEPAAPDDVPTGTSGSIPPPKAGGTCATPPGYYCLPFPGAPGDPDTFPGQQQPPGFSHECFPGLGRYKRLWIKYQSWSCPLP